jgi:hypothetical protein
MTRNEHAKRFIHPDDLPLVHQFMEQNNLRPGLEFVTETEHRVIRRDGEVRHILARARIIKDESGRVMSRSGANQDITERKQAEEEQERLVLELKEALSHIKTLQGILNICSYCHKIRNDEGKWEQMELYIRDRSEADFSHGMCPECLAKYYPGIVTKINE